jgi:hypothetical protein
MPLILLMIFLPLLVPYALPYILLLLINPWVLCGIVSLAIIGYSASR